MDRKPCVKWPDGKYKPSWLWFYIFSGRAVWNCLSWWIHLDIGSVFTASSWVCTLGKAMRKPDPWKISCHFTSQRDHYPDQLIVDNPVFHCAHWCSPRSSAWAEPDIQNWAMNTMSCAPWGSSMDNPSTGATVWHYIEWECSCQKHLTCSSNWNIKHSPQSSLLGLPVTAVGQWAHKLQEICDPCALDIIAPCFYSTHSQAHPPPPPPPSPPYITWGNNDINLSLPWVINVKIPLQPRQKHYITQYGELSFS